MRFAKSLSFYFLDSIFTSPMFYKMQKELTPIFKLWSILFSYPSLFWNL